MTEYRVRWEMDVEADDILGAALEARDAQTRNGTVAVCFEVRPFDDPLQARWDIIDLLDPEDPKVEWEYGQKALFAMAQKMVADGGDLDSVMALLEKPWSWPELLSAVSLDSAFDAVSPGEDIPDTLEDDEPPPEVTCKWCEAEVAVDDKGPYSSGYWTAATGSVTCDKSPTGIHEVER